MRERWRRRILIGLLVYAAAMVAWAVRPWTDNRPLAAPEGAEAVVGEFHCPSVFNSAPKEPVPVEPVQYPPVGHPCDQQGTYRTLAVVDVGLALVGVVLLRRRGGRGVPDAEEEPLPVP